MPYLCQSIVILDMSSHEGRIQVGGNVDGRHILEDLRRN